MCRIIHIKRYPYITLLTELMEFFGNSGFYKHLTPSGVKSRESPRQRPSIELSITVNFRNRLRHIRHLRQNCVFELRCVGDKTIKRSNTADGSVEVFEQFI